jgi:hypothetical protein
MTNFYEVENKESVLEAFDILIFEMRRIFEVDISPKFESRETFDRLGGGSDLEHQEWIENSREDNEYTTGQYISRVDEIKKLRMIFADDERGEIPTEKLEFVASMFSDLVIWELEFLSEEIDPGVLVAGFLQAKWKRISLYTLVSR